MAFSDRILSASIFRLVAIAALPLLILPWFQYLGVAPFGSAIFLSLVILIALPVPTAGLVVILAPFLFFSRRLRPAAFRYFLTAAVFLAAVALGIQSGRQIRRAAFHRLAKRSAPLVNAIKDYTARHGQPPATLSALVPEFLPSVPKTGMAAYPHYDYQVGNKAFFYRENPWTLSVATPNGMLNFDQFLYFPLQNYPENYGTLERIADWGYIHE